MAEAPAYTVSSLTLRLKQTLEGRFSKITVEAEIGGWKRYPSGHAYFTLKDSGAQIQAVMFDSALRRCEQKHPGILAKLRDGAKVLVYGNVSVYPQRGNYQLVVLAAKLVGEGDLMRQYLELKEKLTAEGLFDSSRKRKLPFLPRRIAIVTSEAGAVIHDMCTVLTRRFPNLEIRLYPSLVQGDEAPKTLIAGIAYFNGLTDWIPDLLILARGGGSFEDLFCFNDESLVRALASSRIPTISAVGHETDYTLCDFAADCRAGTPSIAAEIAVPLLSDLRTRLAAGAEGLSASLRARGEWYAQHVDHLGAALLTLLSSAGERAQSRLARAGGRLIPALRIAATQAGSRLNNLRGRLEPSFRLSLSRAEARFEHAKAKLQMLSPYGVLERGYALVTDSRGEIVRDSTSLAAGDAISVRLGRGRLGARVETVEATPS